MTVDTDHISKQFRGKFVCPPAALQKKLSGVRALVFDWDGVFNNGVKNENGSSMFSEVDAMGTNLLRFSHFLRFRSSLLTAIISGEKNPMAFMFARREHFNGVYYHIRHKAEAINHLCQFNHLKPEEIAFVFDDVLDLSAAKICGLRIMVFRPVNSSLIDFALKENLVDYLTASDGGNYAVRETSELLMTLGGAYERTIGGRMEFTEDYRHYWQVRNSTETLFYTTDDRVIIQQAPA